METEGVGTVLPDAADELLILGTYGLDVSGILSINTGVELLWNDDDLPVTDLLLDLELKVDLVSTPGLWNFISVETE